MIFLYQTKEKMVPSKEQTDTTNAIRGDGTRRTEAKINSPYKTIEVTLGMFQD